MRSGLLLLLFIQCYTFCSAQERYLQLSDFKRSGITAQYQDDTTTTYSMLCTGIPNGKVNTDSLITVWLAAHTDATVRPVCSFSYYNNIGNWVTFTYVWIVSNLKTDPNLNIYLVRNGACSAASLLWASSSSILKPTIDHYRKMKSETKVFVDNNTYKKFTRNLKNATPVAVKHKATTKENK